MVSLVEEDVGKAGGLLSLPSAVLSGGIPGFSGSSSAQSRAFTRNNTNFSTGDFITGGKKGSNATVIILGFGLAWLFWKRK